MISILAARPHASGMACAKALQLVLRAPAPAMCTTLVAFTVPGRGCSSSSSTGGAENGLLTIFPGSGLATYAAAQALGSGWSKLSTGLQIKDLSTGRGTRPKPGEQVTVHYTALDNNTDKLYECTFQSGKPAVFNLNEGGTFPGLNDAVADMQPGGRRLAIVPPQLGYGRFSEPPNMTLVVEIELVRVGAKRGLFASLFGE